MTLDSIESNQLEHGSPSTIEVLSTNEKTY